MEGAQVRVELSESEYALGLSEAARINAAMELTKLALARWIAPSIKRPWWAYIPIINFFWKKPEMREAKAIAQDAAEFLKAFYNALRGSGSSQ